MTDLVAGANMVLPGGTLMVRLSGPFDLSALVLGGNDKVSGDGDFVFYNQPTAPGVRLDRDTVTVEPHRLRAGAARVVLVASPEQSGLSFAQVPAPGVTLADGGGRTLGHLILSTLRNETVAQLAEVYRRNNQWKVRAIGQGYADGLAGLARDFGVDILEDGPSTIPSQPIRPSAPPARPSQPPASAGTHDGLLAEVVALTNDERRKAGLRPLAARNDLAQAAQGHSRDMAARDFFAHQSPEGTQVWDRALAAGYDYRKVAENIAAGQRTPAEVVDGWMNSPGHRANILDGELTEIGVGFATGGSYLTYWTQVFGTPR